MDIIRIFIRMVFFMKLVLLGMELFPKSVIITYVSGFLLRCGVSKIDALMLDLSIRLLQREI